jgi:superfamily II DNA or RNA helicase
MQKRTLVQSTATESIIANKFKGIIEVAPRVGKSKIVIDALNTVEAKLKVLITAPRKEIFESWKKEFEIWGLRENISVDFLWSNSLKKNKTAYNLIICDEVHAYNLNVLSLLTLEQAKGTRILSITGTLDGNTQYLLETMLKQEVLYTYTVAEAIEDKIVADYEIICVGCDLDSTLSYVQAGNIDKQFTQTELAAYTYWNDAYQKAKARQQWSSLRFLMSKRLDVIYNSKTKLEATKKILSLQDRAISFSGRQEIADQLGDESFHSKADKTALDRFKAGKINKLSVVSMVSMGVTITDLKVAVFNQLKSEENLAIQQAMRVMNMEGGKKATIYIVYLKGTQDEVWMLSALQGFDPSKIKKIDLKDLPDGNSIKPKRVNKKKSVS